MVSKNINSNYSKNMPKEKKYRMFMYKWCGSIQENIEHLRKDCSKDIKYNGTYSDIPNPLVHTWCYNVHTQERSAKRSTTSVPLFTSHRLSTYKNII